MAEPIASDYSSMSLNFSSIFLNLIVRNTSEFKVIEALHLLFNS